MEGGEDVIKHFQLLSDEAKDYYLSSGVLTVHSITAIEFLRHVSANTPVLIKGGIKNWPAVQNWNLHSLRERFGKRKVHVSVTPNGYADAIATDLNGKPYFVEPEIREMPFSDFIDVILNPDAFNGVCYIQQQDSNLTTEFRELVGDVKEDIGFASEALGSLPVAVNFWMGDERAVTSMHKDPFENLYCVISGHKDFILHPPTDRPWIPYESFPKARYCATSTGHFEVTPEGKTNAGAGERPLDYNNLSDYQKTLQKESPEEDHVPWICIDPLNPNLEKYPLYANSTPIKVRVEAGDIFYLPSLWFHHVQQSHGSIAVNYWYDMFFDIKYVYYQFMESFLPLHFTE